MYFDDQTVIGSGKEQVVNDRPIPRIFRTIFGDAFSPVREIRIYGNSFTDEDAPLLEVFRELKVLCIYSSQVGDRTAESISKLHKLETLALEGTQVSDAGIGKLRPLHKIKQLLLADTKITDRSKDFINGLADLEDLDVNGTQFSASVLEEIFRAHPKMSFEYDGP